MSTARSTLQRELGSAPPPAFDTLPAETLEHLATALNAVRLRQQAELDQALTGALEYVPALMRRPVSKILGL